MAIRLLNLNCISDGTFNEALCSTNALKDFKMYMV
nr:MAG TPA: hypothetical protein [Caudoviricetes sp.]DAR37119.1 MAG TPA: hypothetical protein [Caudoviricetes sp.]